jgi:hypothetical protein
MTTYLLALDQGTSSSRSIVFDREGHIVAIAQKELTQIYPQPGWVEHDPMEIWRGQLATAREVLVKARLTADRHRRHRHHQPARDHGAVGPRRPASAALRHRLARPARRAAFCRELARRGHERHACRPGPGW